MRPINSLLLNLWYFYNIITKNKIMARIAGIKFKKTITGKATSVTIDLKKWGSYLEDFMDLIEIEAIKNSRDGQVVDTWENVKKKMDKKHSIK